MGPDVYDPDESSSPELDPEPDSEPESDSEPDPLSLSLSVSSNYFLKRVAFD